MELCKPWESINALAFHENAIIMELLGRSQGLPTKRSDYRTEKDQDNHYSVQYLLDDLALVASGAGGAPNVAAACMEIGDTPSKCIIIRIAKNEDFTPAEIQVLKDIITIMNRVGTEGNSQHLLRFPDSEILDQICQHHRLSKSVTNS
jgi:hypothetical protein